MDVGDVLLVRTPGFLGRLIRAGSLFSDQPNLDNHVAVLHHRDFNGTWWAVEGRPGGVGWVDVRKYAGPYVLNNALQPKAAKQRAQIAEVAEGLLGKPYDWSGIVADAMDAIHAQDLWTQNWRGQGVPGHVVCSSLAAWVYDEVGLARPMTHSARATTPGDWEQFVIERHLSD